jgi:hypothetical protein
MVSQFGVRVSLTAWAIRAAMKGVTALGHHVLDIVQMCAEEKVIGSYAFSIIAAMQHPQSAGYRAVRQLPGHAMAMVILSLIGKVAITLRKSPLPFPAAVAFYHPLPQCFGERFLRREDPTTAAVSVDETLGEPFNVAQAATRCRGERCGLSTAA